MAGGDAVVARVAALQGETLDLTPDPVLQEVARDAARAASASWSSLALLLRDTLIYRAFYQLPVALATLFAIQSGDSFCSEVVRTSRIVAIADIERDPQRRRALLGRQGVRAYVGVPVVMDGVVVGALAVYDERVRDFTPDETAELQRLAQLAGLRLTTLALHRRPQRRLIQLAMRPAFAELRNRLTPLDGDLLLVQEALERVRARGTEPHDLGEVAEALARVRKTSNRVTARLGALQALCYGDDRAVIGVVVQAADVLAQHHTQLVGGVQWQVEAPLVTLDLSQHAAISFVTATLSLVALRLHDGADRSGLAVTVTREAGHVAFRVRTNLEAKVVRECVSSIAELVEDSTIRVACAGDVFELALPAA
jgi:putative methionine-R-sulfoxide reductase with GAF domain